MRSQIVSSFADPVAKPRLIRMYRAISRTTRITAPMVATMFTRRITRRASAESPGNRDQRSGSVGGGGPDAISRKPSSRRECRLSPRQSPPCHGRAGAGRRRTIYVVDYCSLWRALRKSAPRFGVLLSASFIDTMDSGGDWWRPNAGRVVLVTTARSAPFRSARRVDRRA